jgi:16S rRNA (uracil1498-N3)-methyltransferase
MAELLRFFLPGHNFGLAQIDFSGDVLHHLRNVRRLACGDEVVFLDGQGACCRARLTLLDRNQGKADILQCWNSEETARPISLIQAMPKGDKLDLVLQKGTELGITSFQPVISDRSIKQPSAARTEQRQQRWQRIVQEAARQSRRSHLPHVTPLRPLQKAIEDCHATLKLVLWEEGGKPLSEALPASPPKDIAILIGPEGGFAADEVAVFAANDFIPVHLGPRILRTETAGLAVTSILQYLYGDWLTTPTEQSHDRTEEVP